MWKTKLTPPQHLIFADHQWFNTANIYCNIMSNTKHTNNMTDSFKVRFKCSLVTPAKTVEFAEQMNVLITQQSFSKIYLTSNYSDLRAHGCLALHCHFGVIREQSQGQHQLGKNNGPQRHIAALITTPNGKGPAHNYFKMHANWEQNWLLQQWRYIYTHTGMFQVLLCEHSLWYLWGKFWILSVISEVCFFFFKSPGWLFDVHLQPSSISEQSPTWPEQY